MKTITDKDLSRLYGAFEKALIDEDFLSGCNAFTKYVIAKALLHEVRNEDEFRKLVSDSSEMPAYKHFLSNKA